MTKRFDIFSELDPEKAAGGGPLLTWTAKAFKNIRLFIFAVFVVYCFAVGLSAVTIWSALIAVALIIVVPYFSVIFAPTSVLLEELKRQRNIHPHVQYGKLFQEEMEKFSNEDISLESRLYALEQAKKYLLQVALNQGMSEEDFMQIKYHAVRFSNQVKEIYDGEENVTALVPDGVICIDFTEKKFITFDLVDADKADTYDDDNTIYVLLECSVKYRDETTGQVNSAIEHVPFYYVKER